MVSHFPIYSQLSTMLQLAFLQRKQSKTVNLLLDVHGHQILTNGIFNGDPHPGNILMLSNGKLGLIDYGQCKRLEKDQRLALSKVVMELGSPVVNDEAVRQHVCSLIRMVVAELQGAQTPRNIISSCKS